MRYLSILSLFLALGCGTDAIATLSADGQSSANLVNGSSADAVIGQPVFHGYTTNSTDALGYNNPWQVAVSNNGRLYVADANNARILGYSAAPSSDGGAADLVLGEVDFFRNNCRNISGTECIAPYILGVDQEERLYVSDADTVLVYENPFDAAATATFEYTLDSLPSNVWAIRALSHNRLAVVGASSIKFYERGMVQPYEQATFVNSPCGSNITDIAETGSAFLVSCRAGALCDNGSVTSTCSSVFVYPIDAATGFMREPLPVTPIVAFTTNIPGVEPSIRSIHYSNNRFMVASGSENRVLLWSNVDSFLSTLIATPATLAKKPVDALAIYGQPDTVSTVANYNSTPSLVGQPSQQGFWGPVSIGVLPSSREFFVVDAENHRVLRFPDMAAVTPTETPNRVLGQADYSHSRSNRVQPNSLGSTGQPALSADGKAYVPDPANNRVLIFNNIASYTTGADPDAVLGQSDKISYLGNGGGASISANGLNNPTHVAVDSLGRVYVTDSTNQRVLAYDNLASNNFSASRVFGANDMASVGIWNAVGAIAVHGSKVYVAAGNRILVFAGTTGIRPERVFGQDQPPVVLTPADSDIPNMANRGGNLSADTLYNVQGISFSEIDDGSGGTFTRMFVSDSYNRRVLYFDDPEATDLVAATTADGVVGQPDFITAEYFGDAGVDRGFLYPAGIASTNTGRLYVADYDPDFFIYGNRVLVFEHPDRVEQYETSTPGNEPLMLARATNVFGQRLLSTTFFDAGGSEPRADGLAFGGVRGFVAVNPSGTITLISDPGNNRVLRFLSNDKPVIAGGGTVEVRPGTSVSVTLTPSGPEAAQTVSLALLDPVAPGASLSGNTVTYQAPSDARPGSTVDIVVVGTDSGTPAQVGSATIRVFIVAQQVNDSSGGKSPPRALVAEVSGCQSCSAFEVPYLAGIGIAYLIKLRRRRSA